MRALQEDERRRNLLALGRVSIIIGSLGLVVAALTLASLLAPESGLLPGRAEVNAARLSPEGRHNLALVMGPIEAALGLAGLAVGARVLSGSRGVSRAGRMAGAAGAVAGLLTVGAAVLLFFLA